MPRFSYVAKDRKGETVRAIQEAPDASTVMASLRESGLVPITVEEVSATSALRTRRERVKRGKPNLVDVASFVRQLSAMLGAGVGVVTALDDLATQAEKARFKQVLEQVRNRVVGGTPLSSALKEHPQVFPPLVHAMVRAGEQSGKLDTVLSDLADYLDSQVELRRRVVSALMYPCFVMVVFTGALIFLFAFLLPRFQGMFSQFGKELPIISRYALAFSGWVREWLAFILIGAGVLAIVLRVAIRVPGVREFFDRLKIRLPLVGSLILKVSLVRLLETLATLQRSGVSILMSLDIAGETAGNSIIEREVKRSRQEVSQGSFLSTELAKSEVFPRMMVRMLSVGEETGRLDEMLSRTASFFRSEVDAGIQSLTSLIEPVIIVLIGAVVGFVVLSVYLPIFKLAGAVAG